MSLVDIFEEERGEVEYFNEMASHPDNLVRLPITRKGFEALLAAAAKCYNFEVDDSMRSKVVGYIHHLENTENWTSIQVIANIMYKHASNALTWVIDQEIKIKQQEEHKKAMEEAKAKQEATKTPNLSIVPAEGSSNEPQK